MAHFKVISLPQIDETVDMNTPAALEYLFQNYDPKHWSEEYCDACEGLVHYITDERVYGLRASHFDGLGFSIMFSDTDLSEAHGYVWRTVLDTEKKYFFVDIYSDCLFPASTFVPSEEAWSYIKAYIENPTDMPPKVNPKLKSNLVQRSEILDHPMNGGPPLPEGVFNCYELNKTTGQLEPIRNKK